MLDAFVSVLCIIVDLAREDLCKSPFYASLLLISLFYVDGEHSCSFFRLESLFCNRFFFLERPDSSHPLVLLLIVSLVASRAASAVSLCSITIV